MIIKTWASGPHCIPLVVLKNFESYLSYVLADIFNIYPKESIGVAALDIFKAFNRDWHADFLLKLKFYGISDRIFCLI